MYSTAQIAIFLEVTPRAVLYHINEGNLEATLVGSDYQISSKAFMDFKENYFYSRRSNNKGNGSRPNAIQTQKFIDLYSMVKNGLELEHFIDICIKEKLMIPLPDELERLKRNNKIIEDHKKNLTRLELSKKYKLSIKHIENIIYKKPHIKEQKNTQPQDQKA